MTRYNTCGTCIFNESNCCACGASRYKGSPVKSWNTCSEQKNQPMSQAELVERLDTCAAGLRWQAARALGEYKDYFADRALQCEKWLDDVQSGWPIEAEYIEGGLREFEGIAL